MTQNKFCLIAGAIFAIAGLIHLSRVIFGWSVILADWQIPVYFSSFGTAVAGVLAFYGLYFGTRK